MLLTITDAGMAAIAAAGGSGPLVDVTTIKISESTNAVNLQTKTDLDGPIVYSGTIDDYKVVTGSLTEYQKSIPENVGPFDISQIGIFLGDGTLFAIGVTERVIEKVAQDLPNNIIGNRILWRGQVSYNNIVSVLDYSVITPTQRDEWVNEPIAIKSLAGTSVVIDSNYLTEFPQYKRVKVLGPVTEYFHVESATYDSGNNETTLVLSDAPDVTAENIDYSLIAPDDKTSVPYRLPALSVTSSPTQNQDVMRLLDVHNLGLGFEAPYADDLNTIRETGWFSVDGSTLNLPSGIGLSNDNEIVVEHIESNTVNASVQIIHDLGSNASGDTLLARRSREIGTSTWTGWSVILTDNNLSSLVLPIRRVIVYAADVNLGSLISNSGGYRSIPFNTEIGVFGSGASGLIDFTPGNNKFTLGAGVWKIRADWITSGLTTLSGQGIRFRNHTQDTSEDGVGVDTDFDGSDSSMVYQGIQTSNGSDELSIEVTHNRIGRGAGDYNGYLELEQLSY